MSVVTAAEQVRTARILAASRSRTLRGTAARAGAWVAFASLCAAVAMSGMVADLLRESASVQMSEVFTVDQARGVLTWVVANPEQILATAAAFVLGTAAFTVLSVPAPGRLVDVPNGHLVPTGPLTRYLEGLATSLVSVVPAMQLMVVTAAAGLLTIDRHGRTGAVLLAWALWACTQIVTSSASWAATLARRSRSRALNRALAVAGAVLALIATVLGVTGAHRAVAAALLAAPAALVFVLTLAASGAALRAGVAACERASRLAPVAGGAGGGRSRPVAATPRRTLLQVLALAAWRTPQVRSPLLTVLAASTAALLVAGSTPQALPGVAVGIPVAWSLAFTSNFLAVNGAGGLWMGTLPNLGRPLLMAGAGVGMVGCLGPALLAVTPALLLGAVDASRLGSYALLCLAASVLLTGAAMLLATLAPQPAGTVHGQPLLTPGRTLVWMLLLGALGALAWLAVESTTTLVGMGQDWPGWPYVGAAASVAVGVLLWALAWTVWSRVRTRSMATAGAA